MFSSAALHWIAAITMLIDHIGAFVFLGEYPELRAIGRIAFPVYALMIAEGVRHTRSRKKYLMRVFCLALVSQIPIFLISLQLGAKLPLNILFGFALAIITLYCIHWGWRGVLIAILATVVAELSGIDYGALTVLMPILFYLSMQAKNLPIRIIGCAGTIILAIAILSYSHPWFATPYVILAMPFVCLYSSKKGSLAAPRWIRYAFYPVHLFAIAAVLWLN